MAGEREARTEAKLIDQLVGSILSSVVRAQGLAASQLVEMLETVGFEPPVEGEPRQTRMFEFDFFRNEVDETTQEVVRQRVTARVPLITLVNLPTIAIDEAKIDMNLRIVAHEDTVDDGSGTSPLNLYAVPAQKQLVRSGTEAVAIDAAGTVRMQVTMRQRDPIGLDRIENLLEGAVDEVVGPDPADEPIEPTPSSLPSPADGPTSESMALPADLSEGRVAGAVTTPVASTRKVAATKKRATTKRAAKKRAAGGT